MRTGSSGGPVADQRPNPARLHVQARELEKTAASKGVEIILPTDVIVADAFAADANTQVRRSCRRGLQGCGKL